MKRVTFVIVLISLGFLDLIRAGNYFFFTFERCLKSANYTLTYYYCEVSSPWDEFIFYRETSLRDFGLETWANSSIFNLFPKETNPELSGFGLTEEIPFLLVDDCDAPFRFFSATLVEGPCLLVELGMKEVTWF